MAATAAVATRVNHFLDALVANVGDLPALAEEWEALPEGDRVSTALHWDHLMADYLVELDEYYRRGEMTSDQQARYRELLAKLKDAAPLIRQLKLYPPPVPLNP